jgi:hypothetical protein
MASRVTVPKINFFIVALEFTCQILKSIVGTEYTQYLSDRRQRAFQTRFLFSRFKI